MFGFEKCSYEELQNIRFHEKLILSGWQLIERQYIDITKKVYDEDGTMIALINYYFLEGRKDKMMIAFFEVFEQYRNQGLGKKIIEEFLQAYCGEVHLVPCGESSERFWEKCGFESGCYLDRRNK